MVPLEDEPTLVRVGTLWNYQLVVQHIHKEEISKHMEKSGLTPRDPGWLQQFQWAVNAVIRSLGGEDEVSKKYAEIAKVWNEAGLPEEVKRK